MQFFSVKIRLTLSYVTPEKSLQSDGLLKWVPYCCSTSFRKRKTGMETSNTNDAYSVAIVRPSLKIHTGSNYTKSLVEGPRQREVLT